MGYMSIDNLYNRPDVLRCYALEKIHGTSAHIRIGRDDPDCGPKVRLHAGGVDHARFATLFDPESMALIYESKFIAETLFIYGEAFGAKVMGMSETYGKDLRFLAFDVHLDGAWLDVPAAAGLAAEFGIGFVPYEEGPFTLQFLDEQRDRDSLVAIVPGKMREGIVVRAIKELAYPKTGERFIFKHKRPEFRETKTVREVDPQRSVALAGAEAIATEYVTPMRLQHVLQGTPYNGPEDTGKVIKAMQADVKKEAKDITWTRDVERAVGKETVRLLHRTKLEALEA
jgi:hypothetical protein